MIAFIPSTKLRFYGQSEAGARVWPTLAPERWSYLWLNWRWWEGEWAFSASSWVYPPGRLLTWPHQGGWGISSEEALHILPPGWRLWGKDGEGKSGFIFCLSSRDLFQWHWPFSYSSIIRRWTSCNKNAIRYVKVMLMTRKRIFCKWSLCRWLAREYFVLPTIPKGGTGRAKESFLKALRQAGRGD